MENEEMSNIGLMRVEDKVRAIINEDLEYKEGDLRSEVAAKWVLALLHLLHRGLNDLVLAFAMAVLCPNQDGTPSPWWPSASGNG
jgi:hypothetical protein